MTGDYHIKLVLAPSGLILENCNLEKMQHVMQKKTNEKCKKHARAKTQCKEKTYEKCQKNARAKTQCKEKANEKCKKNARAKTQCKKKRIKNAKKKCRNTT